MKLTQAQSLDRILEAAVVTSWADLTSKTHSDLVQIEYGFAPSGTLDYLKVWSSITRGHWLLACTYWMSTSKFHNKGVHFDNNYSSEGLADNLDIVMQHQNAFALPENLGRKRLLQIPAPAREDSATAAGLLVESFAHVEAQLAQPAVA
jgi:hypothetical protein